MATITGSGKFVAIAASNTRFDQMFSSGISGIVFGNGSTKYARISSRYTLASDNVTVTGTAFCIDPGTLHTGLYLGFPSLSCLRVNGYTGFTGTINVASGCTMNQNTWIETTTYKNYTFRCGLLTNVY